MNEKFHLNKDHRFLKCRSRSFSILMNAVGIHSIVKNTVYGLLLALTMEVAQTQGNKSDQIEEVTENPIQQFELNKFNDSFQIIEKGANHRVWARVDFRQREQGHAEEVLHSYTELASGLNFWNEELNAWDDSRAIIEQHPKGAIAQFGQQKVIFSRNLNVRGAVDLLTPDGQRLEASVIGLSYHDPLSGQEVLLATLKSSIGELVGENQIIYRDAFDDIHADVVYTYRRSGLEQDVVLREQPPAPEEFGLPNVSTRLEVMTEWFDVPQPNLKEKLVQSKVKDSDLKATDLIDEDIDFGAVKFVRGRAFWHDEIRGGTNQSQGPEGHLSQPVMKKWQVIGGRSILYESIEYEAIEHDLKKMPRGVKFRVIIPDNEPDIKDSVDVAIKQRNLPNLHFSEALSSEPMMIAQAEVLDRDGFVVDYTTVVGSSNYIFKADTTYYVNGDVVLGGTTVIEGGAVIKFAQGSTSSPTRIRCLGPVDFKTDFYRPVVFTSMHDNLVGNYISGSTGTPGTGNYATHALWIESGGVAVDAHHVLMRNVENGIFFDNALGSSLTHSQFVECTHPVATRYADLYVGNVLIDSFDTYALWAYHSWPPATINPGEEVRIRAEHLTVRNGPDLAWNSHWDGQMGQTDLKNSLIVDVTETIGLTGTHNQILSNANVVFESVGAGRNYLPTSSSARNAGGEDIDSHLLKDLRKLTTNSPSIASGNITVDTLWDQVVSRDEDIPDLGYHYAPIDIVTSGFDIQGGITLTVAPGTVIGRNGAGTIRFGAYSKLDCQGRADDRIVIPYYTTVQEQGLVWGAGTISEAFDPYFNVFDPEIKLQFVDLTTLSGYGKLFYIWSGSYKYFEDLIINNCRIYGLRSTLSGRPDDNYRLTNNLLYRVYSDFEPSAVNLFLFNNLFFGSVLFLDHASSNISWEVYDNVFEKNNVYSSGAFNYGNNAYIDTYSRISPIMSSDKMIYGGFAWRKGPLGDFYQPVSGNPLLDAASRNADEAGLYHFTVREDGLPEYQTVGDIGLHYPATDAKGRPLDSDGDSIPDHLEDVNGDGNHNVGTDLGNWKTADAFGDWSADQSVSGEIGVRIVYPSASNLVP